MDTDADNQTQAAPAEAPRITLTSEAAEFVKKRLERDGRPNAALRVGVRGGGCNGLIYVFDEEFAVRRAKIRARWRAAWSRGVGHVASSAVTSGR